MRVNCRTSLRNTGASSEGTHPTASDTDALQAPILVIFATPLSAGVPEKSSDRLITADFADERGLVIANSPHQSALIRVIRGQSPSFGYTL